MVVWEEPCPVVMFLAAAVLLQFIPAEAQAEGPRGVVPKEWPLYAADEASSFKCLDGQGGALPRDAINDDYCDCADGSDEPGTSACSGWPRAQGRAAAAEGLFFCPNPGGQAEYVYASRVNDGLCDCCDGSDEWSKKFAQCPNSCHQQASNTAREAVSRRDPVRGREMYKELLKTAQGHRPSWEAEAKRLRDELANLQRQHAASSATAETTSSLPADDQKVSEYAKWMERGSDGGTEGEAAGEVPEPQQLREVRQLVAEMEVRLEPKLAADQFSALAMLVGQCIDRELKGFKYHICFGRGATQDTPTEKAILLGVWGGWQLPAVGGGGSSGSLRAMFKAGHPCPDGTRRELSVTLTCDAQGVLESVEEPRACSYVASLRHPAACGHWQEPEDGSPLPRRPMDEL